MTVKINKSFLIMLYSYALVLFIIGIGGENHGLDIQSKQALILGSILMIPLGIISRSTLEITDKTVTHKNWRNKQTFTVPIKEIQKIKANIKRKGSSWMILGTKDDQFFFRYSFYKRTDTSKFLKRIQEQNSTIEIDEKLIEYLDTEKQQRFQKISQIIILGISAIFIIMSLTILYQDVILFLAEK